MNDEVFAPAVGAGLTGAELDFICPPDSTNYTYKLEKHESPSKHGDICRQYDGSKIKGWKAPTGCAKVNNAWKDGTYSGYIDSSGEPRVCNTSADNYDYRCDAGYVVEKHGADHGDVCRETDTSGNVLKKGNWHAPKGCTQHTSKPYSRDETDKGCDTDPLKYHAACPHGYYYDKSGKTCRKYGAYSDVKVLTYDDFKSCYDNEDYQRVNC